MPVPCFQFLASALMCSPSCVCPLRQVLRHLLFHAGRDFVGHAGSPGPHQRSLRLLQLGRSALMLWTASAPSWLSLPGGRSLFLASLLAGLVLGFPMRFRPVRKSANGRRDKPTNSTRVANPFRLASDASFSLEVLPRRCLVPERHCCSVVPTGAKS